MNELGVQEWIINDFDKAHLGGFAYKQSHRFMAGVPDLRLAHTSTGTWDVEVKYLDHMPRGDEVLLGLTTLQRIWGKNAFTAGMNWGWCLVIRDEMKGYHVYGGVNWNQKTVRTVFRPGQYRARGQGWKDYDLVRQFEADHKKRQGS